MDYIKKLVENLAFIFSSLWPSANGFAIQKESLENLKSKENLKKALVFFGAVLILYLIIAIYGKDNQKLPYDYMKRLEEIEQKNIEKGIKYGVFSRKKE